MIKKKTSLITLFFFPLFQSKDLVGHKMIVDE